MADTAIEWADRVWNPTTGCDRVSPGCDHCYAMTMAKRLKGMGSAKYQRDGDPRTSGPGFGVSVHPDTLGLPLKWRKPQRIFVNSMSDLFHDAVPDDYIRDVFAIMAAAPRHTFQVLTKRHARMRNLLSDVKFQHRVRAKVPFVGDDPYLHRHWNIWPLPNVWLGCSAENQQWADIRIPALLDTPAAVRWVSAEPLLGPLDLSRFLESDDEKYDVPSLNWVVVGGESGHNDRPMHLEWPRSIRDQCAAAGVPFLFKQWGETVPLGQMTDAAYQRWDDRHACDDYPPESLWRVGKKAAGRLLDGRTHDEYPQAVTHA